jgi:amidohydrolase
MDLRQKILQQAEAHLEDVVGIRRHIHRFPELSYEETNTSAYIQEQLRCIGIPFKAGYVKNGIVGNIAGRNPGKRTVALRAEMDALPINEKNDIPFKSENPGIMHACGHDMHMAALLGAGMILHTLREEFEGTVLLVFQPAEEILPGGASLMIGEGAFEDITPQLIIGQHVLPGLQTGMIGYRPGVFMASSDEIYITVKGKGGHGAVPHQLVDPVLIAAHIIVALQQIVSRNANAAIPSVLSFGKVEANGTTNVIPAEVRIEGTFRTMNESWRREAHERINRLTTLTAESMGGSCEVKIKHGYPVLENHVQYTNKAIQFSRQLLGDDKVVEIELRMTSDDFAYYSQHFPAVFYRFGTTDTGEKFTSPVHSPTFMANEKALQTAMGNLSWLAVSFLNETTSAT